MRTTLFSRNILITILLTLFAGASFLFAVSYSHAQEDGDATRSPVPVLIDERRDMLDKHRDARTMLRDEQIGEQESLRGDDATIDDSRIIIRRIEHGGD